ncbi:ABC-type sugar transport system permease subunit [Streptomyces africanus]|uniref:ABC-type sugar transport system permease subunit n=1 Tax=Streptomyces africanus TaxID=231024 RepID=A0ABU0R2X9_9ACTN|nr:hypothetical protein [Streptomyces africanus]MDQ0752937.1 ABC-type sugar transport system permease subunit [Streptomyces africanus]
MWLGPATALILTMVVWPVVEMIRTSLTRVSSTGLSQGFAGVRNYTDLFAEGDLPGVLLRTLVWVVGVVTVTIVVSLGLTQLLNSRFPGRRLVRWALIVPWASSVLMTALIWRWMLNNFYGVINRLLSFPIIWAMTRGGPGFATDTTTAYLYKLAFDNQSVGESAAMAVVNFGLILAVVLVYLRVVRRQEDTP